MKEPSELQLSELEKLPNEVLLEIPKPVSDETARRVMGLLLRTSRRFGIFREDADKMDAIRLVQHVGSGNYLAARDMLSRKPRLATLPVHTSDLPPVYEFLDFKNMPGGDVDVTVYGLDDGSGYTNACRVALSNLDTHPEDGMWQMICQCAHLTEAEQTKQKEAVFGEAGPDAFLRCSKIL